MTSQRPGRPIPPRSRSISPAGGGAITHKCDHSACTTGPAEYRIVLSDNGTCEEVYLCLRHNTPGRQVHLGQRNVQATVVGCHHEGCNRPGIMQGRGCEKRQCASTHEYCCYQHFDVRSVIHQRYCFICQESTTLYPALVRDGESILRAHVCRDHNPGGGLDGLSRRVIDVEQEEFKTIIKCHYCHLYARYPRRKDLKGAETTIAWHCLQHLKWA